MSIRERQYTNVNITRRVNIRCDENFICDALVMYEIMSTRSKMNKTFGKGLDTFSHPHVAH